MEGTASSRNDSTGCGGPTVPAWDCRPRAGGEGRGAGQGG